MVGFFYFPEVPVRVVIKKLQGKNLTLQLF